MCAKAARAACDEEMDTWSLELRMRFEFSISTCQIKALGNIFELRRPGTTFMNEASASAKSGVSKVWLPDSRMKVDRR